MDCDQMEVMMHYVNILNLDVVFVCIIEKLKPSMSRL